MATGSDEEGGPGAAGPQRRVLYTALEGLELGEDDRSVVDRLVGAEGRVADTVAGWLATARGRAPPERHDHVFALGWAPGCEHDMEVAVVDLDATAGSPRPATAPAGDDGSGRRHEPNRAHRTVLQAVLVGLVPEPDEADLEAFAWLADRGCEVVDAVAGWITATRELPGPTEGGLPAET